jgi:hypothetical protein
MTRKKKIIEVSSAGRKTVGWVDVATGKITRDDGVEPKKVEKKTDKYEKFADKKEKVTE